MRTLNTRLVLVYGLAAVLSLSRCGTEAPAPGAPGTGRAPDEAPRDPFPCAGYRALGSWRNEGLGISLEVSKSCEITQSACGGTWRLKPVGDPSFSSWQDVELEVITTNPGAQCPLAGTHDCQMVVAFVESLNRYAIYYRCPGYDQVSALEEL